MNYWNIIWTLDSHKIERTLLWAQWVDLDEYVYHNSNFSENAFIQTPQTWCNKIKLGIRFKLNHHFVVFTEREGLNFRSNLHNIFRRKRNSLQNRSQPSQRINISSHQPTTLNTQPTLLTKGYTFRVRHATN